MSDYDARLVELYDFDNPDGPDHDFCRTLADESGATSILDLGCGTGILTVTFAGEGRTVVGVDPSPTMLASARDRPGSGGVRWVLGDSSDIPAGRFDLAVMTGNVAQHIPDRDWDRTLRDLGVHLRPGGLLAFESRNPAARAWEAWASAVSSGRDSPLGPLEEWAEVAEVSEGRVDAVFHTRFVDSGETVAEAVRFAFRDRITLARQLDAADFDVTAVYGDWRRSPFTEDAALLVVVARARPVGTAKGGRPWGRPPSA